ncbi:hypothetical protein C3L33_07443, partial [Rhododendron williamsianum]
MLVVGVALIPQLQEAVCFQGNGHRASKSVWPLRRLSESLTDVGLRFTEGFALAPPQNVHKELQDTMSQLEAIRHEIRTISFMNPGPLTRRLVDNIDQTSVSSDNAELPKPDATQQPDIENRPTISDAK